MDRMLAGVFVLTALTACDDPKPAPDAAPPAATSGLMVADKPMDAPTKLAIGTQGEASLRVVLSAADISCAALRRRYPDRPPHGDSLMLDFWLARPLEENGELGAWAYRSAYLEDDKDGRGLAAHGAMLENLRERDGTVALEGLELALGDGVGRRELIWSGALEAKHCGRVARAEPDRLQKELELSVAGHAFEIHGASLFPENKRYILRLSRAPHACNTVFTEGYDFYLDIALAGEPPKPVLASLNGDAFPSTPSRSEGLDGLAVELSLEGDGNVKGKISGSADLRGYETKVSGAFEALRCTLVGAPKSAPSGR